MKRCFIFAAGTFFGLRERPVEGELVIAEDGGYRVCLRERIVPDVLIGDFDSMELPGDFANVRRRPVEKDDTDTLAAMRLGLELGCTEFFIYGGTGGKRLDHTLANLQSLLFLRRNGARGYLYDDDFCWTVVENECFTIRKEVEWGLLSVFCLGDRAEGIRLAGVQYPLENGSLTPEFPLGVSNHVLEPVAEIMVRDGALAVGWELPPLDENQ